MTFWLSVLALARLRVVAAPMAVAGVVLAALGFLVAPTVWTSEATTVLTGSPVNQSAQAGDRLQRQVINPLLNFDDSLTTTVSIVVQAMNTPGVMANLGAVDGPTTVVVTDVGPTELLGSKGPFLFITARSTESGEAAADMARRTVDRVGQELLQRQQAVDAPPSQLISVLPVVSPSIPAAGLQYRIAAAVVGFAVGALGVLGYVYWRRVRRLRARSETTQTVVLESRAPLPDGEASALTVSTERSAVALTNGHVANTAYGNVAVSTALDGPRRPSPHPRHPPQETASPHVNLPGPGDSQAKTEPNRPDRSTEGPSAVPPSAGQDETDDPVLDRVVARSAVGQEGNAARE